MSNSNLPPGVTDSMIPDNTEYDGMMEAFWENFWFYNALQEWAETENPMLYLAMCESYMSGQKADRWARNICEQCEDELPIDTWVADWRD